MNNLHYNEHIPWQKGIFALSPLLLLLGLCLLSAYLNNNHAVPLTSLLIITIVYAVWITKKPKPLTKRIKVLSKGTLNNDVITMVWIFLLAGIFSSTSKDIGAIDNLANLMTWIFPGRLLLCGIFLASCTISLVTGTSMGTVLILMPIVSHVPHHPNLDIAILAATVCSGSFFGDNLSLISDTTIAAVQTLGCDPQKKFFDNLRIVTPALVLSLIIYFIICPSDIQIHPIAPCINYYCLLPFVIVLILSITGMNVLSVLFIGIIFNFIVGWITSANCITIYLSKYIQTTSSGIEDMGNLIIITILCSGLLSLIRHNDGLRYIVQRMSKFKNEKWSEFSAALLVSLVNICTINNTVAILTTGPVVKDLNKNINIKDYRIASIIDIFACITQGMIPFGGQVLYAAKEANVSAFSLILHNYFLFALLLSALNVIISGKLYKLRKTTHEN